MSTKHYALCVAMMMATSAGLIGDVSASGGRGGGGAILNPPGQCNSSEVSSFAYLSKISNAWHFGITVVGPGAGDAWVVQWFKNGSIVYTSTDTFPSGFTTIGLTTAPADKGSVVNFMAIATSASGATCTATISVKA